jgi:UDP-N-acetylmuramoyl-L-alanyl-D-glutamate--2,6-diaminopimelate ligase
MALPADGVAILNVADPASALLDEVTPPGVLRLGYAARPPDPACAAIPLTAYAEAITVDERGTHARLAASPFGDALGGRLDLALIGGVHVENALAAALAGHALGYTIATIRAALATFAGVPGRFEVVHRRPLVVVDFAHTPDALARTLSVARSLVVARGGRVLCVFGCGGDRDPGKRREMGAIAGASADVVVVTSDNPRREDPEVIADAIAEGASEGGAHLVRLMDRASAISKAVELATAADIVVIAGKGHEKTQVVGDRALPFDDVAHARDAVAKREGEAETS